MNTCKSLIVSTIINAITKLFTTFKYNDHPVKIRAYAQCALWPDRAAYHAEPTPHECKATVGELGYTVCDLHVISVGHAVTNMDATIEAQRSISVQNNNQHCHQVSSPCRQIKA
jgi:hypothetical protein